MDSLDQRAVDSNWGDLIDVVAPGVAVRSTTNPTGNGTGAGTSFASPLAAGIAAMIWSVDPTHSSVMVEAILENSADDIGNPGLDAVYDWGRVNMQKAVLAARPGVFWVNYGHPGPDGGTFLIPFTSLCFALSVVPAGAEIWIKSSGSTETFTSSTPSTVRAWGGNVTIGQ